jgi:hypothetical protein
METRTNNQEMKTLMAVNCDLLTVNILSPNNFLTNNSLTKLWTVDLNPTCSPNVKKCRYCVKISLKTTYFWL